MQYLSVLGNLGADAIVRDSNGKKFVSFKIADTQKFTDNKGVEHQRTTWVSCAWSSDGGRLLPYLKKGVKVFVQGRPSYRVYSSEKERMMVAGVEMQVFSIELAGGSSDEVPRHLVDPLTGSLVDCTKYYWVSGFADCQLLDARGVRYQVDEQGFVRPIEEQPAADSQSATKEPQKASSK